MLNSAESVLPKTSGTSLSLQQRKNSTRPSSDKSDVIIKKLEEMTKTLSCELAEMTASNDLTRYSLTIRIPLRIITTVYEYARRSENGHTCSAL